MQNEYIGISVGNPYPSELNITGPILQFSKSGINILNIISNPDEFEINLARNTNIGIKIGYVSYGRIGLLLFDFKGFSFEVPFDAGIEKPENIPDLSLESDSSRLLLNIISVDSSNSNIVFGLRAITLSPRITRYFAKKISEQKKQPISFESYSKLVDELYLKYPTYKSIVKFALAFDKAGL